MKGFHKYKKIKQLGHEDNKEIFSNPTDEIFIQEKMDGANFRFTVLNGKLVFGSRTQQLTSDEGEDTNVAKGFRLCLEHIRDTLKDKNLTKYEGLIFYGECMTKHTMQYNWQEIPLYLGFDILYNGENFHHPDYVTQTFKSLGLETVPFIHMVLAKDIDKITDDDIPISKYAPVTNLTQQAEGLVFKNITKQMYAKYVRTAFKEDAKLTFGTSSKFVDGVHEQLIAKYCTNARIEKAIWKFMDDGMELGMQLTPIVSGFVYKDIWEENWNKIIKLNKELDMSRFRKGVLDRCKAVLDQVITNNALSK